MPTLGSLQRQGKLKPSPRNLKDHGLYLGTAHVAKKTGREVMRRRLEATSDTHLFFDHEAQAGSVWHEVKPCVFIAGGLLERRPKFIVRLLL